MPEQKLMSYERLVVREAQSDLALLYELDECAFRIVTQFTKTWIEAPTKRRPSDAPASR